MADSILTLQLLLFVSGRNTVHRAAPTSPTRQRAPKKAACLAAAGFYWYRWYMLCAMALARA